MKIIETKLYRLNELPAESQEQAIAEFKGSFISNVCDISEVWFTSSGLIYNVFQD